MTFQCGDCRFCGKCYPKERACPKCGEDIVLDTMDECPNCGEPITDDMREQARREFIMRKRREYAKLFPKAAKMFPG